MNRIGRIQMLCPPTGRVDAVIDTDTYNELDDPFALAYLLRSGERIRTLGIYAAPFQNERADCPAQGVEKSEAEIHRVLALGGFVPAPPVLRGAPRFLPDETHPVDCPAVRHLIATAMAHSPQRPLYVIGIAAATDIASAILLEPRILNRIVVVWLGGNGHHCADNREFNLMEDVAAARVLFNSGVPLVQLPCGDVVEHFTVSRPELEFWLAGKNPLCSYLAESVIRDVSTWPDKQSLPWTKTIWDVTAVGWLLNENGRFMRDRLTPAPIPEYDLRYRFDARRHRIRYVYFIERDALMGDLFCKLSGLARAGQP